MLWSYHHYTLYSLQKSTKNCVKNPPIYPCLCNEFGVNQCLQQKNIKNGVFIILYLFQLNENSVLLRFSFPIIFHFEFRLKVTINQSFPSTVTPPSKSINVCQINEKATFAGFPTFIRIYVSPGILRIRGMACQECVAKIGDWGDGQTCGL